MRGAGGDLMDLPVACDAYLPRLDVLRVFGIAVHCQNNYDSVRYTARVVQFTNVQFLLTLEVVAAIFQPHHVKGPAWKDSGDL